MSDRKHDFTITIQATPEEVWKALSEAEGIQRWFAPEARVVPGPGGSVWLSWGAGVEGEYKIDTWEPGRRLTIGIGGNIVDYIIESNGTETVLRLVHSGFDADASFDDEYESTREAWKTFLQMLKHGLERHPGEPAQNVSFTRKANFSPAEAWRCIAETGELEKGNAILSPPHGYPLYVMPQLNNSFLAVFCEGKSDALVTVTWILYGQPPQQVEAIRDHWTGLMDQLFPTGEKAAAAI